MTNPYGGPQNWAGEPQREANVGLGEPGAADELKPAGGEEAAVAESVNQQIPEEAAPDLGEQPTEEQTEQHSRPAESAEVPARPGRITVADYVRDGISALALLVSLGRPWDYLHLGAGRAEVVAVTLLSLCTLALPYLARAGVLPATWTVHTTRKARLMGNAPYLLAVLAYLTVDAISGGPGGAVRGGIGTGLALGLAGAVLAAQARDSEMGPRDAEELTGRRWTGIAVIGGGVLAVIAVANAAVVLATAKNVSATLVVSTLLPVALIVALLAVPLIGVVRGSAGARLSLMALGGAVASTFLVGSGAVSAFQVESFHVVVVGRGISSVAGVIVPFLGLLFLPAVAAVAGAPVTRSVVRPPSGQAWVDAAVRAFGFIAAIALFAAAISFLRLLDSDTRVPQFLTLIAALLVLALAVAGRVLLGRSGDRGRAAAILLAMAIVVAGGMLLGAMAIRWALPASAGAPNALLAPGSGAIHLVAAFGLPAFIIGALTVPASVRSQVSAPPRAYTWERPAPKPVRATPRPHAVGPQGRQPDTGAHGHYGPAAGPAPTGPASYGAYVPPVQARQPEQGTQTLTAPTTAGASSGSEPLADAPARTRLPQFTPAQPGVNVPATQQVTGFTAEQASDPSTPLEVLAQIVQDAPHLRPHVAANPSTYPALLGWLGALGDPAVNEALRSRR